MRPVHGGVRCNGVLGERATVRLGALLSSIRSVDLPGGWRCIYKYTKTNPGNMGGQEV